jgi:uncharacterized protein with PIN domain
MWKSKDVRWVKARQPAFPSLCTARGQCLRWDTSALAAILFGEPEAALYIQLIHAADRCRISSGNFLELTMVIESQLGPDAGRQCDTFLRRAAIIVDASYG